MDYSQSSESNQNMNINNIQVVNLRMYYREMVEQLAEVFSERKKEFVRHYKKRAKLSDDSFLKYQTELFGPHLNAMSEKDSSIFTENKLQIFSFIESKEMWNELSENNRNIIWSYLNTIGYVLILIKQTENVDDDSEDANEPEENELDGAQKEELELMMKLLANIQNSNKADAENGEDAGIPGLPESIKNLAEEISKDLNVDELMKEIGNNPIKLLKTMMSGKGNSALMNMVQKVSSKLQEKLQNGEINKEKMVDDAKGMISDMFGMNVDELMKNGAFNNPKEIMKKVMQMMSGGLFGKKGAKNAFKKAAEEMMKNPEKMASAMAKQAEPAKPVDTSNMSEAEKKKHREQLRAKLKAKYGRK